MGTRGSMIYTIGTVLDRAQQDSHAVDLLVEGQWLTGLVVACDGHGVVLESVEHEHAIVRLEVISAVRVRSSFPLTRPLSSSIRGAVPDPVPAGWVGTSVDDPMPMPGPRVATE